MFNKIVLAIPHSVGTFNESLWSDSSVRSDADRWTDWHTDKVFKSTNPKVASVIGKVSRFDCDLERLLDDPLEAVGQGIAYSKAESGATRKVTTELLNKALGHWYDYQTNLEHELDDNSLIIDCHSFPSDLSDVDICIGFNDDDTTPSKAVIELVKNHFEDLGYKVGVNNPYSNSIAPKSNVKYKSLMIELNKRIYLNEKTLQEKAYSYKVHNQINSLYTKLLKALA